MKISEQPQYIGPTLKIFLSMYASVHRTGLKSHLLPIVSRCLICLFRSWFGIFTYATTPEATTAPSLSTAATAGITAVVCSLVAFIAGTVCGVLITVCISRWNKKRRSFNPAPNTQEQQKAAVVYEEMDTLNKKIENGPVKQSQEMELEGSLTYSQVKQWYPIANDSCRKIKW